MRKIHGRTTRWRRLKAYLASLGEWIALGGQARSWRTGRREVLHRARGSKR